MVDHMKNPLSLLGRLLFLAAIATALRAPAAQAAGGQLIHGHYVGYLKIDGRAERFAAQADFYLEAPDEWTVFPSLHALIKLNLGGYHSTEYLTYSYKNIRSDFDRGTLEFDEATSDLVISGLIRSSEGHTHVEGKAWLRSTAQTGTLVLDLVTDEPADEELAPPDANLKIPFAPKLDGQYVGTCDGKESVFQIQTARALRLRETEKDGGSALAYEVVARIGSRSNGEKGDVVSPWTAIGNFAGGFYDPFRGRLLFLGPSSTSIQCSRLLSKLTCSYRILKTKVQCKFERESTKTRGPETFPRQFHLKPTSEQMSPLPDAGTVPDAELASLLEGHYSGFLHHESLNLYQHVALRVVATVSTENPHNPNKIFVSATSVVSFGEPKQEQFISHRYDPRSFYIRPGFVLNATGTDSFILITSWTKGSIKGEWFSQNFGRVGTIELIKGDAGRAPASIALMKSWHGEFTGGAIDGGGNPTLPQKTDRWFSMLMPNQPAERSESAVPFVGSYQSLSGFTKIEPINRGMFDPYTGAIAWAFSQYEGLTIVSAQLNPDGTLSVFWPPAPNIFPTTLGDYRTTTFRKSDEWNSQPL